MVKRVLVGLALAAAVNAQAQPWGQCGGIGFTGPTTCTAGWVCTYSNEYYSQCLQGSGTTAATTTSRTTTTSSRTTTTSSRTTTGSSRTTTTSSRTTTTGTSSRTTTTSSRTTTAVSTTVSDSVPPAGTCVPTCSVGYCTLNGGTNGGIGGPVTTVSSLVALTAAVAGDVKKIVYISGTISGNVQVDVGSNTHVIGKAGSQLVGIGLRMWRRKNVVLVNLKISKCIAPIDNILVQETTNVLIDHCDVSSDQTHDKDYYDGALDMSHATDFVTVSNTYLHDHYKCSLIGHSDNNGAEDTGKLHVTYYRNRWTKCNSREPSVRFGTVHVVNNYFQDAELGYTSRMGAQMLVEYSKWVNVGSIDYVESRETGYVVTRGNDYGTGVLPVLPVGSLSSVPYSYQYIPNDQVDAYTSANAGQRLNC